MNKFLKITIACAALLVSTFALAQTQDQTQTQPQQPAPRHQWKKGAHAGRANPDRQLARMAKQLDLTADQQNRIKPILENQAKQMQDLRANSSASEQDSRARQRTIRQSTMSEIRNVLTPEQQQKMASMRKSGPRGRHRGPGNGQTPQA